MLVCTHPLNSDVIVSSENEVILCLELEGFKKGLKIVVILIGQKRPKNCVRT